MSTVQPGARRLVRLLQRLENICRTSNGGVMNAQRKGLQPAAPASCPHCTPALLPGRQCRAKSSVAPAAVSRHAAVPSRSWIASVPPGLPPTQPQLQHRQSEQRHRQQQQQLQLQPSHHHHYQLQQQNPTTHVSPADAELGPDVEGTVKKVVYRTPGSGYTVLKIKVMLCLCLANLTIYLRRCC